MPLTEVKVALAPTVCEAVDEFLLESERSDWSVLEDVILPAAWVVGIFPSAEAAREAWESLAAVMPAGPLSEPVFRELADTDWRDSYKAHFHAWQFGRLHWVPVWEREGFVLPEGHAVLWLDPGLAFGTGNHETTRLCCERLTAWAQNAAAGSRRVIDAGCGSGILALSAALLELGPIEAFDLDPEAVRVSQENAELNGLGAAVEFFVADLEGGMANSLGDLVLANIQSNVLLANVRPLLSAVAPGGTLVLSGILAAERDSVREGFAAAASGWLIDSRTMGEWADLCLQRSNSE